MNQFKISVLTNITLEPYFSRHLKDLFNDKVCINYILIEDYSSHEDCMIFCESDVIIILINFEIFSSNAFELINKDGKNNLYDILLNTFLEIYQSIYKFNKNIIWIGLEDYFLENYTFTGVRLTEERFVDKLNNALISKFSRDIYLLDFKYLIAKVGINNSYNKKNMYRWNAPYSSALICELANEIKKWRLITNNITKKCIVLDCDNVLWKGVISEDGITNIKLGNYGVGKIYKDFQKYLLYLYRHGIILAVASKNDEIDVMRMFREHDEMVLKEKNISCFQVNWNNKVDNIKAIASFLNIGLDSIVFIDDSKYEINAVKNLLPEVLPIEFKPESVYNALNCININSYVDDKIIESRMATYKTNVKREILKKNSKNYEDYLEKLETEILISIAKDTELNRIAELTQRTNKCTNGKRYNVNELNTKLKEREYLLYSVKVKDKFSDLGLVGAIGIENSTLDLFTLSCRALGRKVEEKMYKCIRKAQIDKVTFYNTLKNENTIMDLKLLVTKKDR